MGPTPGRGHFETMQLNESEWELSGWILHPDRPSTLVRATLNGEPMGEAPPYRREDVAGALPSIAFSGDSGFRFKLPRRAERARLSVTSHDGAETLVEIQTTLDPAFMDLPMPPAELMRRVTGSPDPGFFLADGVRSYTEFVDAIARHRDVASIRRMLDWGCGSGRLSRLFLRAHPEVALRGCDIDREAIDCCNRLYGDRFAVVPPMPPTGYGGGDFDLVIGYSVMSHLLPGAQRAWLAEMRRLLVPGGLFLASVHGPFAARFALAGSERDESESWRRRPIIAKLLERGFLDAGADGALDGIAPAGYYRGAFQTPEWTRQSWSDGFRILEIREGGMQNYQDLVILEKI